MKSDPFIGALPVVAKVLGDRYDVELRIGGGAAYATPRLIVLPSLPADDARMKIRARGFISHEAGHSRHTDFSVAGDTPLEQAVLNCLEDIREEALMSARYPGCRHHLDRLRELMVAEGDITPARVGDPPGQVLQKFVLHRLNVDVLGRGSLAGVAAETGRVFLRVFSEGVATRLAALAYGVTELASTGDVKALAKRLLQSLDDEGAEPEPQDDSKGASGGYGSSDAGEDPASSMPSAAGTTDDVSGDGGSAAQGEQADARGTEDTAGDDRGGPGGDAGEELRRTIREALGAEKKDLEQDLGEKVAARLIADGRRAGVNAVGMAGVDETPGSSGSAPPLDEVRRATVKLRTRLYGLVQATRPCHERYTRSGVRLDRRRLHLPALGDGRVFRARRERVAVDTAVFILLDRSTSMEGRAIDIARRAALATAMALDPIRGVSVATAAFPFGNDSHTATDIRYMTRFGRPVRASDYAIGADHYTPMAEALWRVGYELLSRPETRRVVLTVTDGLPTRTGHENEAYARRTRNVVERLSGAGFEMLGLGIGTLAVEDLFPVSRVIEDVTQLPGAMFTMLERRLPSRKAS